MESENVRMVIMTEAQLDSAVERIVERLLAEKYGARRKKNAEAGGRVLPRLEAARLLGVSVAALDHWTARGKIRREMRGGRVYYSECELRRACRDMGMIWGGGQ